MNRCFKKILCGGIILGSVLPRFVSAAEVNFGTMDSSQAGVTNIPIKLELKNETQDYRQLRLTCETDVGAVDCVFKLEGTNLLINGNNRLTSTVGYIDDTNNNVFPNNSTVSLGNLVLTNSSETKYDNVKVTLTYEFDSNGEQKKEKVFIVNGLKPKSADATLKNVTISSGSINPAFNKNTMEYTIYNIADTINSITFNSTCNDGNCEITYEGGKNNEKDTGSKATLKLNQGDNTIKITVKSENGAVTNVYTFKTIRGETTYNSSNLLKLSVGIYTLEPAFVPNNYEYNITVPNKITSTAGLIDFLAVDTNAKVQVDEVSELKVGENIINIVVTNVLGDDAKTYKLHITRLSDDDIDVTAYLNNKVTFTNANGKEITLSFIDFELQYPEEAEKINNETYKFDDNGRRIHEEIKEDNQKEEKNKKNKIVLIIILVVVGLAIIIISGILIFRKKKTKLPKTKEEKEDVKEEKIEMENEIEEEGIEEKIIGDDFSKDKDATIDIDQALNDLMNTKQYDLNNEDDKK